MRETLEEIRCGGCQRKLGEGRFTRLEIKCPRCKAHVSVNDIPEMRQAFKGLHIKQMQVNYTVGASGQGRGPKHELVICNFKPG